MALNAYLVLKGQQQGNINGSVTKKGRENSIEIIAVSHEIVSPRDAASGLPTGKRQHKPITITKEIDKSTPLLHKALVNNENITEFKLKMFRPGTVGAAGGAGKEVNHFTIELVNASIASIALRMDNNTYPENVKRDAYEEISFTYQKIIWTYVDGGITAEDDWEAPVAASRKAAVPRKK